MGSIKAEIVFELRRVNLVTVIINILKLFDQRTTYRHVFQLLSSGALDAKRTQKFSHRLPIMGEPGLSIRTHDGHLAGIDHFTLSGNHYAAIVLVVADLLPFTKLFLSLTLADSVASSLNLGSMITIS